MLKLYGCFVDQHDLRLVGLAAGICALSALTAIGLVSHARHSSGPARYLWVAIAAMAGGSGIWATHFIGMLAFSPNMPTGYDVGLTVVSLVAVIAICGIGFGTAAATPRGIRPWASGAIVGVGIAVMHYTGMLAFDVAGRISWDPGLVVISILFGGTLASLALHVSFRDGPNSRIWGALLLGLAVVGHHFTAMGALTIQRDSTIDVARGNLPPSMLSLLVACVAFVVLLLALGALTLDIRDRRRTAREFDRMRSLADAAVEGLIVCDGDMIVTANSSLASLSGHAVSALAHQALSGLLPDAEAYGRLQIGPDKPIETELRHADSSLIPVEVLLRSIEFAGRPHVALAVRDLRARRTADQRIRFLANYDALTGLPNRASFNEALDAAIRAADAAQPGFALFCLDLDQFKEVNDVFGHLTGDLLLQTVAKRLRAVIGDAGTVARLGGDEFAVLLPTVSEPAAADRRAREILAAFREESTEAGQRLTPSSSIGIAFYPRDASDRQMLLSHADMALYCAKSDGRGVHKFFEAEMGAAVRDRRSLEHDLRQSLVRGELRIVYQPQARMDTGETVGFEALLRWRHPVRGDVSPAVFIPIAEETGSILQIGAWVLKAVCAEAATWSVPLRVAVNVSTVQLHAPDFVMTVAAALTETGLAPERLELEITETALVRDFTRAVAALRQLKALGTRIAMDDFGTGYSSLSTLRAFPFDKIKIDGSFVHDVDRKQDAAAIVRAVVGLGRGLDLPILAEGVETREEWEFLGLEACDEAQGYLLGKPSPIETFEHIVRVSRRVAVPAPTMVGATAA